MGSIASNGCGTFEKLYSDAIVTCNGLNAGGLVGKINADGTVSVTAKTSKMTNCWFDGSVMIALEDITVSDARLKEDVSSQESGWEAGTNHPSGAASRILSMMEMNSDLITEFPFVKVMRN